MRENIVRIYHFAFPIIVALIFILLLYILFPDSLFYRIGSILILYVIPPAGKESIVPLVVYLLKDYYGIWSIFISSSIISTVDILVAWWVGWNWDLVKIIPIVGEYVEKVEKIGKKKWEEHTILRKFAYAGMVVFVAVPFQGSGSFTATIIGRVLGLEEYKLFASIALGSIAGTMIIAFGTYFAIFTFGEKAPLIIGGIIIFIIVIGIIYKWLKGEEI